MCTYVVHSSHCVCVAIRTVQECTEDKTLQEGKKSELQMLPNTQTYILYQGDWGMPVCTYIHVHSTRTRRHVSCEIFLSACHQFYSPCVRLAIVYAEKC